MRRRHVVINGVTVKDLLEVSHTQVDTESQTPVSTDPEKKSLSKRPPRRRVDPLDTSDAIILSLPVPALPEAEVKVGLKSTAKPFVPLYSAPSIDIDSSIINIKRKKLALDIARIAQEHKGILFGGFVRDCIVLGQPFTDIDLWFHDKKEVQSFLAAIGTGQNPWSVKVYKMKTKGADYPFDMQEARVFIPLSPSTQMSIDIDCVISSTFPVNDFTCNLLTYDALKKEIGCGASATDELTAATIISSLKAGQCYIFPSYAERCKVNSFAYNRFAKRSLQLKICTK